MADGRKFKKKTAPAPKKTKVENEPILMLRSWHKKLLVLTKVFKSSRKDMFKTNG